MWITFIVSNRFSYVINQMLVILASNDVSGQGSDNKCDNKCDHYNDSNCCFCRELIIWFILLCKKNNNEQKVCNLLISYIAIYIR